MFSYILPGVCGPEASCKYEPRGRRGSYSPAKNRHNTGTASNHPGLRKLFVQFLRIYLVRVGPHLPFGHEFAENLGMLRGDVAALGAVGGNVE